MGEQAEERNRPGHLRFGMLLLRTVHDTDYRGADSPKILPGTLLLLSIYPSCNLSIKVFISRSRMLCPASRRNTPRAAYRRRLVSLLYV